ncbi:DUF4253 domain-containing protein [Cytophaga aurantiaca]|uniref:DUF4253 domain-containing protein n=1 Tax=Cytophaga aurantiaca TaxID=29530 RepID=UPI0003733772|nr:DUF4253 domain-containing protein [Cytophaga aurantiaca]
MRLIVSILTIGLLSLFGCEQKSNLTPVENELLKKINFSADQMVEVKNLTKNTFKQLPAIDQETGEVLNDKFYDGIYSETTEEAAEVYTKQLKAKFKGTGYLVFTFEGEDNKKNIAVIKGVDELDILRYRRTDGINYDLENKDIIKKVAEWQSKYGVVVIGCNRDWLHVEFDTLPTNMDEFAKEVYEFCPDSVDQGVGSIEALKEAIIQMHGVWLWWD